MLAVIGGSGVYDIEGLNNARWIQAESSFGRPSDEFLMGELGGETVVFLPRHGRGHRIPPTQINYRANIDALKRLGAGLHVFHRFEAVRFERLDQFLQVEADLGLHIERGTDIAFLGIFLTEHQLHILLGS